MKLSTAFNPSFLKDSHFLLAVLFGPIAWALLWAFVPGTAGAVNVMLLINMSLLYPLLEELAFRGFLQGWLLEKVYFARQKFGLTVANVSTSIVFALAHVINQPPLWAASIFFPSLVFGYFRDRHDTVITPFILHAWYNAGFLIVMYS